MASKRKTVMEKVGIDTNFWIYHLEGHPQYSPLTEQFLTYSLNKNITLIISSLTIVEAFVLPLKHQDSNLIHQYCQLFNLPNISTVSLDTTIAFLASQLRATYSISTPDSIHLATAIHSGGQFFVSNDLSLSRVSQIKVISFSSLKSYL